LGTGRYGGGGTGDNGGGQLMMAMMLLLMMVVIVMLMAVGRRGGEAAGHVKGQVMMLAQKLKQNNAILGFGTIPSPIKKVVVALKHAASFLILR
jgi:hypothetical protein